jgi:predicted metal-dependent phosphoesterase TrpH
MTPREIVRQAKLRGLDLIGIADHNSGENVAAVRKAGKREGLSVIGGMEITTSEEVHVLGFFNEDSDLEEVQETVYRNLEGTNDEALFGEQAILDGEDNVLAYNRRLLIGSVKLSLQGTVKEIHSRNGLAIASHIDRERFGIVGQLGFVPRNISLDGLEVSSLGSLETPAIRSASDEAGSALVAFSDAHYPGDVGRVFTVFRMEEPTISEMRKALKGEDGRSITACHGHC